MRVINNKLDCERMTIEQEEEKKKKSIFHFIGICVVGAGECVSHDSSGINQ